VEGNILYRRERKKRIREEGPEGEQGREGGSVV